MKKLLTAAVAVAFLWSSPAFACGGACSADAFGALTYLAVAAGAILALSRALTFFRQRRLSRAMVESAT